MQPVAGAVLVIAALTILLKFRARSGVAHPLTEKQFIGMALPIIVLCLFTAGVGLIVSWGWS